jgi:hypothetical protein
MKIRDRIKELRRVKASELIPNEKNWRRHGKAQSAALKGLLAEIGYADALTHASCPTAGFNSLTVTFAAPRRPKWKYRCSFST